MSKRNQSLLAIAPRSVVLPPVSARILIVDDDASVQQVLAQSLARAGYTPVLAGSGAEAILQFRNRPPALVLLDLMLPDSDGLSVCRSLRAESAVPILILSALGGESEQVALFDAGADDYLVKPARREELLARIRRALARSAALTATPPTVYQLGTVRIDLRRHQAWRDDAPLPLSPSEWTLLLALAQASTHVQTVAQLCEQLWPDDPKRDGVALHPVVTRLRSKLGEALTITNVRGVGYRLDVPASSSRGRMSGSLSRVRLTRSQVA
ncbi:response regulator transcription factor [Oscillochloris sp. ZM17-4]|uniref:response regulator transcription factor n=1 Tax=Oscillochloris sp. ZM17-4 TaxID=2866714 RepID=UPI001C72F987|nr:response regulator transcription factor [Oscillochloris sp. ZM17-4]